MLNVTIPAIEVFDESTGEFYTSKEQHLSLEHSLVSVSKWESKWHKPFLSREPHTAEEMQDYIRCMTLTQNVDPIVYRYIPRPILNEINQYIDDPMTATWFSNQQRSAPS